MKDKFIKNGVFSLEYDKETLRDMVLELQEENQKLKAEYGTKTQIERDLLKEENEKLKAKLQLYQGALKREHEAIHRVNDLEERIDKATNELFILKDMIYKPETREENFEIQRKISSIIKRLNGKEVE